MFCLQESGQVARALLMLRPAAAILAALAIRKLRRSTLKSFDRIFFRVRDYGLPGNDQNAVTNLRLNAEAKSLVGSKAGLMIAM